MRYWFRADSPGMPSVSVSGRIQGFLYAPWYLEWLRQTNRRDSNLTVQPAWYYELQQLASVRPEQGNLETSLPARSRELRKSTPD
jgi:hypothetical protein